MRLEARKNLDSEQHGGYVLSPLNLTGTSKIPLGEMSDDIVPLG